MAFPHDRDRGGTPRDSAPAQSRSGTRSGERRDAAPPRLVGKGTSARSAAHPSPARRSISAQEAYRIRAGASEIAPAPDLHPRAPKPCRSADRRQRSDRRRSPAARGDEQGLETKARREGLPQSWSFLSRLPAPHRRWQAGRRVRTPRKSVKPHVLRVGEEQSCTHRDTERRHGMASWLQHTLSRDSGGGGLCRLVISRSSRRGDSVRLRRRRRQSGAADRATSGDMGTRSRRSRKRRTPIPGTWPTATSAASRSI